MLDRLQQFTELANQTNSSNDKKGVIKQFPDLIPIFELVYSPYKKFNITSKVVKDNKDLGTLEAPKTISELLNLLCTKTITGHEAVKTVNGFIEQNSDYEELIYNILDKNLKTRTDAKLINKVFPKTVPTFDVQLAESYKIGETKIDFANELWYSSIKLDGVRAIAIKEGNVVKIFSRKGIEFETLDLVKEAILSEIDFKDMPDFVLDGEICIVDNETGVEDFKSIMKLIRRKNYTIENPRYKIFDILTIEEFEQRKGYTLFHERYEQYQEITSPTGILSPVRQIPVRSEGALILMLEEVLEQKREGLIIRKNVPYKGKRSKDMYKLKKFIEGEYTVKSIINGYIRFIEDGVEHEEEMLSAVVIEHSGYEVRVGSGFSLNERKYYYNHPEELVGKVITVSYFEEMTDKNDTLSLRFPTLKAIHGDKREV